MMIFLSLCLALTALPQTSWAQAQSETAAPELTGTRKQVATIIFSGLAGAILGLSTLSFYGRPQDHMRNIAYGAGLGIITGVAVTSYGIARSPYEGLQSMNLKFDDELSQRQPSLAAARFLRFEQTF
jgi:hypothetical protein